MTDEEILIQIRSGGSALESAVKALYLSIAQPMLRFFVFKGVSSDEAKDILQETVVKIVRGANTYKSEDAAKAWIWQIARNCLTDHLRKRASIGVHEVGVDEEQWRHVEESSIALSSAGNGSEHSVDACVDAGLKSFTEVEPDRAHALLLQMDGYSIDEIGLQIGRTLGATKEYLSQCKKKIQPFIAHCTELLQA